MSNRCVDCDVFESVVYDALAELAEQAAELTVMTIDDLENYRRTYTNAVVNYHAHRKLFHRVLRLDNND
jgi:hypothetical protein